MKTVYSAENQGPMRVSAEIGRYRVYSEGHLKVYADGVGYFVTNGGIVEVSVARPGFLEIETGPKVRWHMEFQQIFPFEPADPVPVEVPADARLPETMEQKMIRYLGRMVAERYGSNSPELETFEEYTDFDVDDEEGIPVSGFEVWDDDVDVGESTQSATVTTTPSPDVSSEEETSSSE